MESKTEKFGLLQVINLLDLLVILTSYGVTLSWVGLLPAALISCFIYWQIQELRLNGLSRAARLGLFIVIALNVLHAPLNQATFNRGLQMTRLDLPFGVTTSTGAWYLVAILTAITCFAFWAAGSKVNDRKQEEAESRAESKATTERKAERNFQLEQFRIETEAKAEIRKAEIAAKAETRKLEIEAQKPVPLPVKLPRPEPETRPGASAPKRNKGNGSPDFADALASAKAALAKKGNANPTQKELAAAINWRGAKGVSDRTLRTYLNATTNG